MVPRIQGVAAIKIAPETEVRATAGPLLTGLTVLDTRAKQTEKKPIIVDVCRSKETARTVSVCVTAMSTVKTPDRTIIEISVLVYPILSANTPPIKGATTPATLENPRS